MGKYNLGKKSLVLSDKLEKKEIYINENKSKKIINDIDNQLNSIKKSFNRVQVLLNQSVKMEFVTGKRATAFKSWARKAKSQANQAEKLSMNMNEKYAEDVRKYPIQILDNKIAELERKISELEKE